MYQVNQLSESLLGTRLLPYHHAPTQHNEGEYFGVEYLYRQAERQFVFPEDSTPDDFDNMDEGFEGDSMGAPSNSEDVLTVGVRAPKEEEDDEEEEEEEEEMEEQYVVHTYNTLAIYHYIK